MAEEKNIPGVATEKESDEVLEEIRTQTKEVLKELLAVAKMKPGQILVVGCSSSEIGSYKIGSHSSETIGQTVYKALYEELKPLGIYLAAQCCEHLNRSLILEEEAAEKYGYECSSSVKGRWFFLNRGLSYPGTPGCSRTYQGTCRN